MSQPVGADFTCALIGGSFIGTACGAYMVAGGYRAGASGHLKSLVVGPRNLRMTCFVLGLIAAALLFSFALPGVFERFEGDASTSTLIVTAVGGLLVGVGTNLGNGCTSGHGLCGISRLSLRSVVATPTFLVTAIVSATLSQGLSHNQLPWPPKLLPLAPAHSPTLSMASWLATGLLPAYCLLGMLTAYTPASAAHEGALGVIVGFTFAAGVCLGGMVRPSVVLGGLTPAPFNLTLWVLFCTALCVTFGLYRLAHALGREGASSLAPSPSSGAIAKASDAQTPDAKANAPTAGVSSGSSLGGTLASWAAAQAPSVDRALIVGEILFGVGWGLTGFCPGPLVVALVGAPAILPALNLLCFAAGTALASTDAFRRALVAPAMV